jgi:hypothetical protein
VLKLLILPERVELALRAEVVRVAQAAHESPQHPRGVAVRFLEPDPESLTRLSAFVAREPKRARPVG